jgi:(1->4)-alpha-D-glucan 1-alpha-D-glucosylmutase
MPTGEFIERAIAKAKESNPGLLFELDFIERFCLLRFTNQSEEERKNWTHFVMRFQQLTGPLMAKGFEDTTLYIYGQLLALNDVGGDPDRFGVTLDQFHRFNRRRAERWPHALNATATHDTKRGEDARARILVISELAEEWERHLKRWSRLNRSKKEIHRGDEVPDTNDEYFLYQTLAGAWPLAGADRAGFLGRLKEYLIKAVREAKVHTEWLKPDLTYEDAYVRFRRGDPRAGQRFCRRTRKLVRDTGISRRDQFTSPDCPQDRRSRRAGFLPGNRTLGFEFRRSGQPPPGGFLAPAENPGRAQGARTKRPAGTSRSSARRSRDGAIKLYVVYKGLQLRRNQARLFLQGEYLPLAVAGEMAEHVCAFARCYESQWVVAVVPRLLAKYGASLAEVRDLWLGNELLAAAPGGLALVQCFHRRNRAGAHDCERPGAVAERNFRALSSGLAPGRSDR